MNLYILRRLEGASWDEARGFVVRAESEAGARLLASKRAGDEEADTWLNAKESSCEVIAREGEPEIILRDFFNG